MARIPQFAALGTSADTIDVRLSYRIVKLFSEGLYASPNKALEELVANSFDAGAQRVHVWLDKNLHHQSASIIVVDDGQGMNAADLKQHWLIGYSDKRTLSVLPRGRQQIGRFGIGKLATYVLASRLTHIAKRNKKYYSASIDYTLVDSRVADSEVESKSTVKIPLRELTVADAKQALNQWSAQPELRQAHKMLFGRSASKSWTVAILSSLKPKVHEIRPGMLEWLLRTALPLRPDFEIWLNGKQLAPSKEGKGLLKKWILGKDLTSLPKPSPKQVRARIDSSTPISDPNRFALEVPQLGRITGYAEAYQDLLTGKSDELGRSHGFFVYVLGRLVNVADGHFGIPPDELRHGTFGRTRIVVHIDSLDDQLRSNRESLSEGPILETARNLLRAVFNSVRPTIEQHDQMEDPGARLARRFASSPASLSRRPIIELARNVLQGRAESKYLVLPETLSAEARTDFLNALEQRAADPERFVTDILIDYSGSHNDGLAQFLVATGKLRINAWHPFVATFYDEFISKGSRAPLEVLAMAEVLLESHLHSVGVSKAHIETMLYNRDQLIRNLANESGRGSALSVASNLLNSKNNAQELELALGAAFQSLGFSVTPLGKRGQPEGVAIANVAADSTGEARAYKVSYEAKSKERAGTKVSAKSVGISAVARQRDEFGCDHAVVVGPEFPTTKGDESALAKEILADRSNLSRGESRTVTLITVDDLARLVRLRPIKQVGLSELRGLFLKCSLPQESKTWVDQIQNRKVVKPKYRQIVESILRLQNEFSKASVDYSALRVQLLHIEPPVRYETDQELADVCKGMAQMAPRSINVTSDTVELDQSVENVMAAIDSATVEYPVEEQA